MQIIKWLLNLIRGSAVPSTPTDRFTWERVLERAELPHAAKLVGLLMATFANPDGSRVRPGQGRIAAACDWSEKYIAQQIKILRDAGLLLCVRPASGPYRPPLYQLSLPDEQPVPMRLDPDGYRIEPKQRGRGGAPKGGWPKKGTGVSPDPNPSSPEDTQEANPGFDSEADRPNSGFESTAPESGASELELADPRTPVPEAGNSSSPNHPGPTTTNPVSGSNFTPTRPEAGPEPGEQDRHNEAGPEAAYRAARRVVDGVSTDERNNALAQAHHRITQNGGIPNVRAQVVLAAQIIGELRRLSEAPTRDRP